jgi:hypothetical protein
MTNMMVGDSTLESLTPKCEHTFILPTYLSMIPYPLMLCRIGYQGGTSVNSVVVHLYTN